MAKLALTLVALVLLGCEGTSLVDAGPHEGGIGCCDAGGATDAGFTPIPADASIIVPPDQPLEVEAPRGSPSCEAADEELIALCGELDRFHVSNTGRPGAAGTADDPFATMEDALAHCGTGCEVRVATGDYAPATNLPMPPCVWLSGGWQPSADGWTHEGGRSTVRTGRLVWLAYSEGRLLIEHFDIAGPNSAIGGMGELLSVRDVRLAEVETAIALGDETDARICGTSIDAELRAIDATRATDVLVHQVSLRSRGVALNLGGGAARVLLSDSILISEGAGVTMTETSHVQILRSRIEGGQRGVVLGDQVSHVLVQDSEVYGCRDAILIGGGAWNIKIVDTVQRSGC
ncbi:MAG: right-handed parallel beta-helix repeat-containing protein [Myxococcales bacterium]|nr:right-handed parallel beta-helix repeat-containing protein [Myxococcales bacterium]